jgi:uncharacterized repeat protein (TIGR03803 family)
MNASWALRSAARARVCRQLLLSSAALRRRRGAGAARAPGWPRASAAAALLALGVVVVSGQPAYQVIKSFGFPDLAASSPGPVIVGSDGRLYGTAREGGSNNLGFVFRVNRDGSGYTALRHFAGGNEDAARPDSLMEASDGALYGTAPGGGAANAGAVFKLNKDGSGYQVLHGFGGGPQVGSQPRGPLLEGGDGKLYSVTEQGGASGAGTLFSVGKDGSGFTTLHTFSFGPTNAINPRGGLAATADGQLFGVAGSGASNAGGVFTIHRSGSGFQLLRSFTGSAGDGRLPLGGLLLGSDGALFGTTFAGGSNGFGTVFKLNTNGAGYTVLRRFTGGTNDGVNPQGRLLEGSDGALYGATQTGGSSNAGTIFKLNKDGTGYSVLRSATGTAAGGDQSPVGSLAEAGDGFLYGAAQLLFKISKTGMDFQAVRRFRLGGGDGWNPLSEVMEASDGFLYGTTFYGGSNDLGTVFRMSRGGSNYTLLHQFSGAVDGARPRAALVEGNDGLLYGTTYQGGSANLGTVFKLNKSGGAFASLRSFTGTGGDGWGPQAPLLRGSDSLLYGTTERGGSLNNGTVFRMNTNGSDFTVLRSFGVTSGIGWNVIAGLIEASDGRLYGTAQFGGSNNAGTVFRLDRNGSNFMVLRHFMDTAGGDGARPVATLREGSDGRLYGVASQGGSAGSGTVFGLNKDGSGYAVLHHFIGGVGDGAFPRGPLWETAAGVLLGTTYNGGGNAEAGTVFRLKRDGSGFFLLHTFTRGDGDGGNPRAGLIRGGDGAFYGTTQGGGSLGGGTAFRITDAAPPSLNFAVLNTNDGGPGSLRQAITDANASPAISNRIVFAIPGFSPHVITPASALPALTARITLDGYTQPGATPNTSPGGFNANLRVMLDGSNAGAGVSGLRLTGSNCLVRGLAIGRFAGHGVSIESGEVHVISGNALGLDASLQPAGNGLDGVRVNGARHVIGGPEPAARNAVAHNARGLVVVAGAGHALRANRVFAHTGLGLDLGGDGVTPNDPGDADVGANLRQNFPLLARVTHTGANLLLAGTLNSAPNAAFHLDFYANAACHPSGHGEGEEYLGALTVNLDGSGQAAFQTELPTPPSPELRFITATATDAAGNTSEFSPCAAAPVLQATFTVRHTNDTGPESLRQALLDAAASTALTNTVAFDIPGPGPHVIAPLTALPLLAPGTILDGYTQPGAVANTLADGFNADLRIVLDGAAASFIPGLRVGTNNTVRGLAIVRWRGHGLVAVNGRQLLIEGNSIGLDPAGQALGNLNHGLAFEGVARDCLIGGVAPAARNVISANGVLGIGFDPQAPGSVSNAVLGNFIGTDFTGALPRGNRAGGVWLEGGFNRVGGVEPGAANVIAFNRGAPGLWVSGGFNPIRRNRIFGHEAAPGIDLFPAGVNLGQNYPVLDLATHTGGGLLVRGTLDSRPNQTYEVEFFANEAFHPSGYGEGQFYLDSTAVTTDAAGHATFEAMLPAPAPERRFLSATATDAEGNTSEFSLCVRVTSGGGDRTTITLTPVADAGLFAVVPTNNLGANQSLPAGTVAALQPARSLLRFDVAGALPSDANIISARLELTDVRSRFRPLTTFALHPLNVDWGEGDKGAGFFTGVGADATPGEATWLARSHPDTLWAEPGGGAGPDFAAMPDATAELETGSALTFESPLLDLTVKRWLAGHTPNHGWLLKEVSEGAAPSARRFGSREHPISPPRLVIEYEAAPEILTVVNTNDSGPGSLRAALLAAAASTAPRAEIVFAIPGAGPHTILPLTPLPPLWGGTTLFGMSQPGARRNASPDGNNAVYAVRIDGGLLPVGTPGFTLGGSGNTVEGLALLQFSPAINIEGGDNHFVIGNHLKGPGFGFLTEPLLKAGVRLAATRGITVGGPPSARNVISGHEVGVLLAQGSSGCGVLGNFIGTDVTGATMDRNGFGVFVNGASGNRIGLPFSELGNRIAYHSEHGVRIWFGTNNAIRGNALFANRTPGIELAQDGVTPNDPGDLDTGPNQLQNFPVLLGATSDFGGLTLSGTLDSAPNAAFEIDFFASTEAGFEGHVEGRTFLGFVTVQTDGAGQARFTAALAAPPVGCQFVTATATDSFGNTSEFSAAQTVSGISAAALSLLATNGGFRLTWPNAPHFLLDSATNLTPPVSWQPVTHAPFDDGRLKSLVLTNSRIEPARFFRLRK